MVFTQEDINNALKECVNIFNKNYQDLTLDFNELTGQSTEELLDGYEDFDDFKNSSICYAIKQKGSPLWDIISKMDFKEDNRNHILLCISYTPTAIVEELKNDNMLEYDYCEDEKELINELYNDYFYIDLSNPLGY